MSWVLNRIALGIRHKRLFGFLSRAGEVIDTILPLQGTGPFPEKCFNKIGWPNQITVRIQDDDENFVVECNIDGVVLKVNLAEIELTHGDAKSAFVQLAQKVLPITGGDRFINRVGIVDEYVLEAEIPGKIAVRALTRLQEIGQAGDFKFRASFRRPTDQGLVRGDVSDWKNTILDVSAEKKEEDSEAPDVLRVSIDYQSYFSPERRFVVSLIENHYEEFLSHSEGLKQRQLADLEFARVAP